ncbi:MAG TPA: ABC transporter permease [Acidobacteriaceae bacterium]|jgi:predicted permease|nr:ABC transporter permease [Acidobacteriaceae bacterium]
MGGLWHDVRYALRQLRNSPGFAITAVLTLALGIGANTAIFTLVHAILIRSLPVGDPSQLYRIGDLDDCCVNGGFINENGDFDLFSYDLYKHLRDSAPEFSQLAAMQAAIYSVNVRRGSTVSKASNNEFVSGNYFSTFGIGAFTGRVFTPADDTAGATPVAVLSYQAWQADYAGDPSIVGSTLYIQGQPVTIVGIAPPGFYGDRISSNPPAFWIPLADEPVIEQQNSMLHQADTNWLYAIGRIRPGTNVLPLQQKLSASLRQWLVTEPAYAQNGGKSEIPKQHVVLAPAGGGIQNLQQEEGSGLRMLMFISGLVLLIACANIANLLLTRGAARRSETSIRMALGAARKRLIRQVLTESILLGCLGGLAGLGIAYLGTNMILSLAFPDSTSLPIHASPSLPVLGFTFALSLLTGVVFGIAPAWLTSHSEPAEALRGINRATGGSASLPQKSLVIFQAALSLVLLTGAGLLIQSLRNLEHQEFGIATANRYVVHLDPAGAGYTTTRLQALYQQMEQRFSALPGVQSVGLALYSPLEGNNWGDCVNVEGRPAPGTNDDCGSSWDRVSPDFFATVGQPILRGRGITEQDTQTSRFVAVVNQAFVKKFFPKEDPIGKHFGTIDQRYASSFEIVGVVADAKYINPRNPVRSMFFRPLTQQFTSYKEASAVTGETRSMFINAIVIHFKSPQQDADALIRRTLGSIDPNLAIVSLHTLDYQVSDNFDQERLTARLTGLFGLLALILASVGLYGVTAYSVARRTREIGLRMALGATRSSVVSMVLRGAVFQILFGLGLGIPVTLIGGHFIANQLYGVHAYDLMVLTVAALILFACAFVAGYIPARRAASIDPMQALRSE